MFCKPNIQSDEQFELFIQRTGNQLRPRFTVQLDTTLGSFSCIIHSSYYRDVIQRFHVERAYIGCGTATASYEY
jgi:hypothetical protein